MSAQMSLGDPYSSNGTVPYSSIYSPGIDHYEFVANQAMTVIAMPEFVTAVAFGEHAACENCEYALACMSGAFKHLAVATTREEQREAKSLPCIDEGKVRLRVLTEAEATRHVLGDLGPWTPQPWKSHGSGLVANEGLRHPDAIGGVIIGPVPSTTNAPLAYPAPNTGTISIGYPYTLSDVIPAGATVTTTGIKEP